jgi:hypothetical protein
MKISVSVHTTVPKMTSVAVVALKKSVQSAQCLLSAEKTQFRVAFQKAFSVVYPQKSGARYYGNDEKCQYNQDTYGRTKMVKLVQIDWKPTKPIPQYKLLKRVSLSKQEITRTQKVLDKITIDDGRYTIDQVLAVQYALDTDYRHYQKLDIENRRRGDRNAHYTDYKKVLLFRMAISHCRRVVHSAMRAERGRLTLVRQLSQEGNTGVSLNDIAKTLYDSILATIHFDANAYVWPEVTRPQRRKMFTIEFWDIPAVLNLPLGEWLLIYESHTEDLRSMFHTRRKQVRSYGYDLHIDSKKGQVWLERISTIQAEERQQRNKMKKLRMTYDKRRTVVVHKPGLSILIPAQEQNNQPTESENDEPNANS